MCCQTAETFEMHVLECIMRKLHKDIVQSEKHITQARVDMDDDVIKVIEGNPNEEHPLKLKGSSRQQQMESLLDMTDSLHDCNEASNDLTKVPTVDLPFIPQQEGTKDDDKGDITEYAHEVEIEQIIYQEDDISYGLMSEKKHQD